MSSSIGFHITLRLEDDRVILRDPTERRLFARIVTRIGRRYGLLAFGAGDSHLHLLVIATRKEAGRFARAVAYALRRRLRIPVAFAPARFRPIEDQRHLANAFFYQLRQEERHGTDVDPFHDGSCLPDLIGMRIGATYLCERVQRYLPRVKLTELVPSCACDVPAAPIGADDLSLLAEAAAAAVAAPLVGRSARVLGARRAAMDLAPRQLHPRLGPHLGCGIRSLQRLRRRAPDPALLAAIRGQLTWRRSAAAAEPRYAASP